MTEQADRFTPYLHEDWRGMIGVTASMRSTTNGEYVRVEVYQSQAARIAELEAENAILRTEKHADAEAIAAMKEAGMDRLVAEGQRCDAMTPQEAAKNSDTELLDAIAANYWDLKCVDVPTPGGDDADVDWIVVEHHMGKKGDVTIAQAYTDDPRAALRRAISETSQ